MNLKSKSEKVLHIGILSAMQEEVGNLVDYLTNIEEIEHGDLKIFSGEIKIDKNSNLKGFFINCMEWLG